MASLSCRTIIVYAFIQQVCISSVLDAGLSAGDTKMTTNSWRSPNSSSLYGITLCCAVDWIMGGLRIKTQLGEKKEEKRMSWASLIITERTRQLLYKIKLQIHKEKGNKGPWVNKIYEHMNIIR